MAGLFVYRPLLVGFNQQSDRKWLPEGMKMQALYPVFGVENGTIKRQDGSKGDAVFYHFVGEGHKPCRLIQSNCVLVAVGDDEWTGLVREDAAGMWIHFMGPHKAEAAGAPGGSAPAA